MLAMHGVQGVGDIYTDPQIHTLDGEGYGSGNLGLRGMAMFFRTHECNDLCRKLELHEFERCVPLCARHACGLSVARLRCTCCARPWPSVARLACVNAAGRVTCCDTARACARGRVAAVGGVRRRSCMAGL